MIKTIILSMCLAASLLSLMHVPRMSAQERLPGMHLPRMTASTLTARSLRWTTYKLSTGIFEEYIDWLNSTWKPTMEAMKKAGLIIDYKVFQGQSKITGSAQCISLSHF